MDNQTQNSDVTYKLVNLTESDFHQELDVYLKDSWYVQSISSAVQAPGQPIVPRINVLLKRPTRASGIGK